MGDLKQHHLECKGGKERENNVQSGEREWEEICLRNPYGDSGKTSGEEYIRQLNEKIRGGREGRGRKSGEKEQKRIKIKKRKRKNLEKGDSKKKMERKRREKRNSKKDRIKRKKKEKTRRKETSGRKKRKENHPAG